MHSKEPLVESNKYKDEKKKSFKRKLVKYTTKTEKKIAAALQVTR